MTYSQNNRVNQYIDQELDPDMKELFLSIRSTVLEANPSLNEDIKWKNCLTYAQKKNLIQTVVGKDKITLIFFEGIQLDDPEQLLEGDGKKTRSFRIGNPSFNKPALTSLVIQASALAK